METMGTCYEHGHHDSQHNSIQHNDIQLNDTLHKCTLCGVVMPDDIYAECHLCWLPQISPLCRMMLRWMSLYWVSLCWMSWSHEQEYISDVLPNPLSIWSAFDYYEFWMKRKTYILAGNQSTKIMTHFE
jgi:hypothetical protein